jgi:hypothetical protein
MGQLSIYAMSPFCSSTKAKNGMGIIDQLYRSSQPDMKYLDYFNGRINASEHLDGFPVKGYFDLVEAELNKLYKTVIGQAIFAIIKAQGWGGDQSIHGQRGV